jgi:hypothetical protein
MEAGGGGKRKRKIKFWLVGFCETVLGMFDPARGDPRSVQLSSGFFRVKRLAACLPRWTGPSRPVSSRLCFYGLIFSPSSDKFVQIGAWIRLGQHI